MLPEELGQRPGAPWHRWRRRSAGTTASFPWGEPDPVGVGIALQVLSFLAERTKAGKGPVYRIAFHEVSPDAEDAGDGPACAGSVRPRRPSGGSGGCRQEADKALPQHQGGRRLFGPESEDARPVAGHRRGAALHQEKDQGVFTKSSILTRGWRKENAGSRRRRSKSEAARPTMSASAARYRATGP